MSNLYTFFRVSGFPAGKNLHFTAGSSRHISRKIPNFILDWFTYGNAEMQTVVHETRYIYFFKTELI